MSDLKPLRTVHHPRPMLELDGALRLLARVHLRPDPGLGFSIMIGATPGREVDRDAYARAWETVVNALGGIDAD